MLIKTTLQGISPLLCNRFTDEAAQKIASGMTASIQGARPAPRDQAQGKLYLGADSKPVLPAPNLMRSFVDAGQFIKSGRSKLSTQRTSIVPAGVSIEELELPLHPGRWECDSRSVVIPSTGGRIMCHRPRFDEWRVQLTINVDETLFSEGVVRELVNLAGARIGVGDFRPARRGPYGRFRVDLWKKV